MIDNNTLEERIKNLEKRVELLEKKKLGKSSLPSGEFKGLAGAILDLVNESFFDAPKDLGEIHNKLKANAIFYPKTSYPESLLRLIRNKKLRRLKENNKWKYVKNE